MLKFKRSFAWGAAACLGLMMGTTAQAHELGRRYLAIDQTLHGEFINSQMVLGQATNHQEILLFDQQWEIDLALRHNVAGDVIRGHDGILRAYYPIQIPLESGNLGATAIAYSNDGINWTKPKLNAAPHLIDDPNANVINLVPHASMADGKWPGHVSVFYDPIAPVHEQYKVVWKTGTDAYMAASEDGINFGPSQHIIDHRNESNSSAFYDPIRGAYVMYGRIRGASSWNQHGGTTGPDELRRGAALHYSANWNDSPWTNVGVTVLDPEDIYDYSQELRPDFYSPNIFAYRGQYIGMPSTYFRDEDRVPPDRPERWTGTGPIYPIWIHSLDGADFYIPDTSPSDAHSAIDLEPHLRINPRDDATSKEPEVGQLYASSTILDMGDKLLVYFSHRTGTHYEGFPEHTRHHYVGELRVDGFASIKADEGEKGEWITNNLVVPGNARGLWVNADVAGALTVEVLDSEGNAIGNLSLADSIAFQGDETEALMQWENGRFNEVAGETVQLRFVVEDGEIYSFSFSSIPEPASLTLLGLGGAMLLRRRRA